MNPRRLVDQSNAVSSLIATKIYEVTGRVRKCIRPWSNNVQRYTFVTLALYFSYAFVVFHMYKNVNVQQVAITVNQ